MRLPALTAKCLFPDNSPATAEHEPLLLSIIWDVTDQVETEEALRKNEARFRALVTATSDAVYRLNADATMMMHLDGHGLVLDTREPDPAWLDKYVYPDDRQFVMAAAADAIRTKSMFRLEHRVLLADGSVGWFLTRGVPVQKAEGAIAEWFGCATGEWQLRDGCRIHSACAVAQGECGVR